MISEDVRQEIAEYSRYLINNDLMSKNPTGEGRYRKRIDFSDSKSITQIIDELNSCFEKYNGVPDSNIGNIITHNYIGSNIQPHQDEYNATQMRINIIIEKEENSGNPIIGGLLYRIKQRGGWLFSPSSIVHGSTKLKTDTRINLSLGWNFKNVEDYNNAFVSFSSQ
jgi:hypothetical protein